MSEPLTDILFVTYAFPPRGGVAVQRILSFVAHFPANGFRPIVLTVHPPAGTVQHDPQLMERIPPEAWVLRTTALEPYRIYRALGGKRSQDDPRNRATLGAVEAHGRQKNYAENLYAAFSERFLVPDAKIGWFPMAMQAAETIFQSAKPAVVFASNPPASALVIGDAIARKYSVPLIADYRDPWNGGYYESEGSEAVRNRNLELEKGVLERAAAVIHVGREFANRTHAIHPSSGNESRFRVISNGFEGETFKNLNPKKFEKITLLYCGSLYQHRSPQPLFEACLAIQNDRPKLWNRCEVILEGNIDPTFEQMAAEIGLKNVIFGGFVPHTEALEHELGADVLLLLTEGMLTAKVYEYLACKKPICAIGPSVELGRLLRDWRAGDCFDRSDISGIAEFLTQAIEERQKRGRSYRIPLAKDLKEIQRGTLAEQCAEMCWTVIEGRPLPGRSPIAAEEPAPAGR